MVLSNFGCRRRQAAGAWLESIKASAAPDPEC